MYAEARYYSAELGRFVSADGLFVDKPEECVGSPLESGLYGYAKKNPVKYTDPSGKSATTFIKAAVIVALKLGIINAPVGKRGGKRPALKSTLSRLRPSLQE